MYDDDADHGSVPPKEAEGTRRPAGNRETRDDRAGRGAGRRPLVIAIAAAAVLLVAGAGYGWHWYTVGRFLIDTDDAYTQADNVTISPQVSGTIQELGVTDNQQVRAGDLLMRIDPRIYQAQVDQAAAQVQTAEADIRNVGALLAQQDAAVAQATAELGSVQAQLQFAQEENNRYSRLIATSAGSVQQLQQAQSNLRNQQAASRRAQANLDYAKTGRAVLETKKPQAEAEQAQARAALEQAQTNLGYTAIAAPIDGVIGDRSARAGQYVAAGTKLMTIVPMRDVYVVANYKETQLARMHQGQPVDITVDAYDGVTVHGRVDSLAPGSGAQFALLPPENATGNFTKIVQRVPVKILIERDDPLAGHLRPGLSVEPTVDSRDTRGQSIGERPSPGASQPPPAGRDR